ncbi:hypothetical protein BLOT_004069 [Blomia tropicalis]|nr:hypothetical protein BLOT_004069 [Blomia tropicalis]
MTIVRSTSSRFRMRRQNGLLVPETICTYPDYQNTTQIYQLSSKVIPKRYRIRFRIDKNYPKLYGHETISIYIHNQTNIIELNSVNLTINGAYFRTNNVRVNIRMVYYCPERETIVLHFSKPLHRGNGNLTINFSGNLSEIKRSSSFFKLDDSLKLVTTNFGPIDARHQFPCWDEPKFRANFDLYMVVPKDNVALFNQNFDQRRPYTPDFDEIVS